MTMGDAHQSDRRAGPTMDHPALGGPGDLSYEVGCPAFTRELRQFQWPSHRTFKPDVGEKYNGKTHPSEFLSIYTIAMQATGARDDKVLAILPVGTQTQRHVMVDAPASGFHFFLVGFVS